ncbi:hypothetical protein RM531_10745 [Salinisphaera sp. P385]|uniref:Uncharacterized protein n=1 Tax=Spectribacter acetivorans TaxID=3075603 RepID=A0ABU3B8Z9_9GAMM|nr:hypothetical protein [Salinisphaera sp. P385]MDT0618953.1 hypothetical protein [Salinisphaera sp. P385]
MIDNRRFWLVGNLVTLLLHAAGLWLYVTDGFNSPVAQLWAVIIAIHILEIPLAFLAVAERRIPWGLTVINTLIFGFTWWVPTRRGVFHA